MPEDTTPSIPECPPAGFEAMAGRAAVERLVGPFYERMGPDGRWQLGFRVTPVKLNQMGVCHGGVIALFADIQGSVLKRTLGLVAKTPTVRLDLDYVGPARPGAWVQAEPRVVAVTRGLLFFESLVLADDVACARVSGIYRILARSGGTPE